MKRTLSLRALIVFQIALMVFTMMINGSSIHATEEELSSLGEWLKSNSRYQFRDHRVYEMIKDSKQQDSMVPKSIFDSLIDFKNSTFKPSIYVQGDFSSSCNDKSRNRTFAYYQAPYLSDQDNSFKINIWYPFEQYLVSDCMNVRDNYHFCAVSNGTIGVEPTPFCIKMEEKDDKFRIGLNTNFYDCLVDEDFDIEPECDILSGNVIFVYESPGEKTIYYRNIIAIGLLIVVGSCCCCVIVCVFGTYCYLIRRRKRKLLERGGSINGQEMDEDEARNLNKW